MLARSTRDYFSPISAFNSFYAYIVARSGGAVLRSLTLGHVGVVPPRRVDLAQRCAYGNQVVYPAFLEAMRSGGGS